MVTIGKVTKRLFKGFVDPTSVEAWNRFLDRLYAQFEEIINALNRMVYFDNHAKTTQSINAGASFVLPRGRYIIQQGPFTKLQFNDAGTWRDIAAIGVGIPHVESDGTNYRLTNIGGAAENSLIFEKTTT